MVPILFLALITYLGPLVGEKYLAEKHKKILLLAIVAVCVGTLVWYKYTAFIISTIVSVFNADTGSRFQNMAAQMDHAVPPLAISFFIFEFCHYLIDAYHGKNIIKKVDDFLLFALFFPTLVAGPIKRYMSFLPEVNNSHLTIRLDNLTSGFARILIGLFKKLFLADTAAMMITDMWGNGSLSGLYGAGLSEQANTLIFVLLLYVRIYMDFSAYSDIAIGTARIFGIRIPENFNFPFLARNLSDFWKRWHISLSSWIRDYVYIPIGGSQCTTGRRIFNSALAMLIVGLWHGAAWNFVLWGLLHGVGLAVQNVYGQILPTKLRLFLARIPIWANMLTFLFVSLSWILFFYSPSETLMIIKRMF